MESKTSKFIIWIALIYAYMFAAILIGYFIESFHIKNDLLLNIANICGELFITLILVLIFRKDFKNKFKELNNKEGNKILSSSIKIWLCGLFFMVVLNMILNFFVHDIAINEELNRNAINTQTYYAYIAIILFAPICEEILFRLAVGKFIDNKYLFIIFSGLLFGFAHVVGTTGLQALYILPYAALGMSFATIYYKSKNILCSIMMHALHNLMCIILIFII